MSKIPVTVKKDHIEALVATKSPLLSIAELIWNGFDADASSVSVRFDHNALDTIDCIRVQDNGGGMCFDEIEELFGSLGGSWKGEKRRTPSGRSLHGKSGKGRFRAFALGSVVEWKTSGTKAGKMVQYAIKGSAANLENFELSKPVDLNGHSVGTEVSIWNIHKNFTSLTDDSAPRKIANYFALYLAEYPNLRLDYNGAIIDLGDVQLHKATYPLGELPMTEGGTATAEITIIEWAEQQGRTLHLCDSRGISLHELAPGIQAPGYTFSAYLRSEHLRELDREGYLCLEELHPDVASLVAAAKGKMKAHFRTREAEKTRAMVEEWKDQKIYPYEGEATDPLESAERQVFDVVAVNLSAYLEDFEEGTETNKRFTFSLVKQALKENPESLQHIFENVLKLPKERQDDLADLLKKTSLTSIISAAKVVADRLDFLRGLEIMLFDKESKIQLLERDQLHKILSQETWIFGENFHLTSNEDTLEEVLAKYLFKLGKRSEDDNDDPIEPVQREGGKGGRVDLMLARGVPQPRADEWEHLVVELKRPSKKIDDAVISQIKSYAIAVAKDERFLHTKTRWSFWVISNEMTDEARRDARQRGRVEGVVYDDSELNITVWAKTWAQLIQECRGRLTFFKEHLSYEAGRESAKNYLQKTYEKYLPAVLKTPVHGVAVMDVAVSPNIED